MQDICLYVCLEGQWDLQQILGTWLLRSRVLLCSKENVYRAACSSYKMCIELQHSYWLVCSREITAVHYSVMSKTMTLFLVKVMHVFSVLPPPLGIDLCISRECTELFSIWKIEWISFLRSKSRRLVSYTERSFLGVSLIDCSGTFFWTYMHMSGGHSPQHIWEDSLLQSVGRSKYAKEVWRVQCNHKDCVVLHQVLKALLSSKAGIFTFLE